LIKNKERLNRANLSMQILDCKIARIPARSYPQRSRSTDNLFARVQKHATNGGNMLTRHAGLSPRCLGLRMWLHL
jgi:hypothetical protein